MADLTMVPEKSKFDISRPCETDLSSKQYHYVLHDTSELVAIAGLNAKTLGILQNAPNGSSRQATAHIRTGGISKLKLDEAVKFGNFLTSSSAGQGEICNAQHEEWGSMAITSGDDGDIIAVIVCHGEVTGDDTY